MSLDVFSQGGHYEVLEIDQQLPHFHDDDHVRERLEVRLVHHFFCTFYISLTASDLSI